MLAFIIWTCVIQNYGWNQIEPTLNTVYIHTCTAFSWNLRNRENENVQAWWDSLKVDLPVDVFFLSFAFVIFLCQQNLWT